MTICKLYSCFVLILFVNVVVSLDLRIDPFQERFRRYSPQSPRQRSFLPFYQNSKWFDTRKRFTETNISPFHAGSKKFLDFANLRKTLKFDDLLKDDVFHVDPDEYPEEDKNLAVEEIKYRYSVRLDQKGEFLLDWDIDPVLEEINFRLIATVAKTDLLLFGFSDYGEAIDADLMVMWTNQQGHHLIQDSHTDSEGKLHVDEHQDYHLDDVAIQDGRLNIAFHRKYDTCDDDDYMIDSGTTHVIFHVKPGILDGVDDLDLSHVKVGLQRVQLLKCQLPDPDLPDDTEEFVMHVEKVKIPSVETTYWLSVKKLPDLKDKHHVIKFEGAISPQSVGIVHHMEVFHCDVPTGHKIRHYNGPSSAKSERPEGLESCRQVIGAWAMGAQALSYPEEAGYPIGGQGFSRYVMLEIHYNNVNLKQGISDSSGIKFHITRRLRKYDAGTMEVGLEYTDKMALPPGQPVWKLNGFCISECTQTALPEGGIKVFASQLHTHLTGRRTYTKHYRNGAELPDLNRDEHYSPHYQEIRRLPRPVTVLPGDALVHVCEDSTVDRENITLGGFAISDEMCVNYMHYYPRTELEVCKSSVTTKSLHGFFKFMRSYNHQPTSPDMGISDNYHSIDWSPLNIHLLRTFYDTAPLSMQCNRSDGSKFPGVDWEGVLQTVVTQPSPPPIRPCLL